MSDVGDPFIIYCLFILGLHVYATCLLRLFLGKILIHCLVYVTIKHWLIIHLYYASYEFYRTCGNNSLTLVSANLIIYRKVIILKAGLKYDR